MYVWVILTNYKQTRRQPWSGVNTLLISPLHFEFCHFITFFVLFCHSFLMYDLFFIFNFFLTYFFTHLLLKVDTVAFISPCLSPHRISILLSNIATWQCECVSVGQCMFICKSYHANCLRCIDLIWTLVDVLINCSVYESTYIYTISSHIRTSTVRICTTMLECYRKYEIDESEQCYTEIWHWIKHCSITSLVAGSSKIQSVFELSRCLTK